MLRAVRRAAPELMPDAKRVLAPLTLVAVTTDICERAALLEPSGLRSLDAIHLATALELGRNLDGLITYDDRLAQAANAYGIPTLTPR